MYDSYIYPFSGNATITLTNLPAGQYDLYLYANDGNFQVQVRGTDYGVKTSQDAAIASPPVWQEGQQYRWRSAAIRLVRGWGDESDRHRCCGGGDAAGGQ